MSDKSLKVATLSEAEVIAHVEAGFCFQKAPGSLLRAFTLRITADVSEIGIVRLVCLAGESGFSVRLRKDLCDYRKPDPYFILTFMNECRPLGS